MTVLRSHCAVKAGRSALCTWQTFKARTPTRLGSGKGEASKS
eukprot:CAMPEP_0179220056 /NCGR_PEP_ID=MMETSP0797-20121207/5391_1 /TAXON_ID=47934 /ORGANISM="Dinophysis acuminata, Strain DAEP01" /LENGTH=41 /DNA_ID= /DNA_START= /DNA_END= /DNA_ORIENTATION=